MKWCREIETFLLLLLLLLFGCLLIPKKIESQELRFEIISQGQDSRITEERLGYIQNQRAWNDFWASHFGTTSSAPIIEFQKETVIVVHLGTRSSSGYAVKVTKIEDQRDILSVYYEELRPGPLCGVATVLTHPFQIIKILKTNKKISFIRAELIRKCKK